MYKLWIVCFLICLYTIDFSHAQSPISMSMVISMDGDTTIDINLKNISSEEYILWMQDWRVLFVDNQTDLISHPDGWPLANFLYIYPKSVDMNTKFSVGIFYTYTSEDRKILHDSFKVLLPQQTFQIHLIIKGADTIKLLQNKGTKLVYLYSIAESARVIKVLNQPEYSKVFIIEDKKEITINGHTLLNQRWANFSTKDTIRLENKMISHYFEPYIKNMYAKKSSSKIITYSEIKK